MTIIYPNLASELKARNLSFVKLAKIIGMAKTTMYRRLCGESEWKLHEVLL